MLNAAQMTLAQTEGSGLDWGIVWSTVFTGIVVVFIILIILIIFLVLFGKIFKALNNAREKREKKKLASPGEPESFRLHRPNQPAAPAPVKIEAVTPDEIEYEEEDDDEIIAVIAAAIAAYGAAEGKQYRIASVKRPRNRRSGWSSAGLSDSMRGLNN